MHRWIVVIDGRHYIYSNTEIDLASIEQVRAEDKALLEASGFVEQPAPFTVNGMLGGSNGTPSTGNSQLHGVVLTMNTFGNLPNGNLTDYEHYGESEPQDPWKQGH